MSTQTFRKLRAWVKTSGQGIMVPGSVQFRKERPVGPNWHELTLDYCCDGTGDSIITLINKSSNNVTGVSFTGTKWVGIIPSSTGILSFVLPRGYDQSIIITYTHGVDVDYTTSTLSGSGVIAPASDTDASGSFVVITTAIPNSQYLLTIVDD